MTKPVTALLLLTALTGCDSRPDERLEMNLGTIRALCAKVADEKATNAPEKLTAGQIYRIDEATKAECELEYRIKQQEANKYF